ncbi:hypothetical protein VNO78_28880 [Psophocarpus tetragonolobus]|uniref:Uncharacterized protein n=1 Tax=Psophocarpus tetragonolobus TaxID=3891 RepID=A0AAN9RTZ1_PSOTE
MMLRPQPPPQTVPLPLRRRCVGGAGARRVEAASRAVGNSVAVTVTFIHNAVPGFFVLLLVVGATVTFLNFLSPTGASWFPDFIAPNCGDEATLIAVGSRKLKEDDSSIKSSNNKGDMSQGTLHLNDYSPIDPVPSTAKASLNPGPLEHGTPLNPYVIPKPSPPNHPKPGDSN